MNLPPVTPHEELLADILLRLLPDGHATARVPYSQYAPLVCAAGLWGLDYRHIGQPCVGWEFKNYAGRWLLADREAGVFVMVVAEWSRVARADVVSFIHIHRWRVAESVGECPCLRDPRTATMKIDDQNEFVEHGDDYQKWRLWMRGAPAPVPNLMVA